MNGRERSTKSRQRQSRDQRPANAISSLVEPLEARFLLSFVVGERVVTIGDTACRASASTTATLYTTIPAGKYGIVQQRGADNGGFEWYRVDWDNYSYPLTDGWSAGGSPRFVSAPSISSVSPNPVTGSNSSQNFTVNGSSFVSGAIVRLKDLTNGGTFDKTPTSFATNRLVISANFTTAQANWSAQVINPGNAGSNVANFTVNAPTVTPSISSLSPNPVTGSNSYQSFTVNGSSFVSGAIVRLRDVTNNDGPYDKTPTSFSNNRLVISAIFTVNQANWTAQVINPGNAGSNVIDFTVNAPVVTPSITSVDPNPVTGSDARQPFHVHGTDFSTTSVIKLRDLTSGDGPYTFQSGDGRFVFHDSTHLGIDPIFTTAAHQWSVEVVNTGNASSGQFSFDVVAPAAAPSISNVSPNPITFDPANKYQTLTINGANFVNEPTIILTWSGQAGYTLPASQVTFINSSQLTISIKLGAAADNWTVKAVNPDAQASSVVGFQAVAPMAAPSISGVTPDPVTADPNNNYQTLTISGSNFVNKPAVVLTWSGQSGYTLPSSQVTFVSSGQLQISIKLGASADDWTVKVINPDSQASSPTGFRAVVGTTVDLRGLDVYVPASAKWGQTISVSPVDIKNYGTGAAGSFHVQWYLSKDTVGSADDILLPLSGGATSSSIAGLAPGATAGNFSVSLQLPANLPTAWSGSSFYVVMKTDSADEVTESNENNNFGQVGREYDWDSISITANTQYSNLVPQAVTLSPDNGLADSDVKVSFTVINNGPVASFATTANVRLSTSSTNPSPSDPLLGTVAIDALTGNGGQQSFAPTYRIPAGASAGQKYIWIIVEPTGAPNANQGSGNAGDDLISAVYTVNVPSVGFNLSFPLSNRTAYTAAIRSVFDHAMTLPYKTDGKVEAYTGEVGLQAYGTRDAKDGYNEYKQDYPGTPFSINGQYLGGSYLSYDGHPGYDYRTVDQDPSGQTNVLAAAGGVVKWVAGSAYNTIIIDHENGYTTHYLHLSSRITADGSRVNTGDVIGVSGDTGSPGNPHLHFEVQYHAVPVDPYGWSGAGG